MSKYNSKCSLNCNEKGCGIHICQRYADYQQGKADQKEEDNKFFNFEGAWELEKQKIKQDGAKEFAEKIKSKIEKRWYRSELDMGAENVNSLIDHVLAEWQKEVNNE